MSQENVELVRRFYGLAMTKAEILASCQDDGPLPSGDRVGRT